MMGLLGELDCVYPAAANCAAEISIKCSRHQLGIHSQKRLLCILEACEEPVAPINKISINIDEKCAFHWREGKQNLDSFKPTLRSKHLFEVQRVSSQRGF